MRSRYTPWLPLVWVLVGGCHLGYRVEPVSRPEVDPLAPSPELGTVCLLRPQTFGYLATFQHYDNGRLVGVSQGPRVYFCYRAHPGRHQLIARSDNDSALDLLVRAGERHFVRLEVNVGPDEIVLIGEEVALPMLPSLRYVVAFPTQAATPRVCRHPVPAAVPCPAPRHPAPPADACPVVLTPL